MAGAVAVAFGLGATLLLLGFADRPSEPNATAAPAKRAAGMPLYFIENRGQTDGRARYYMQGKDASVFFTSEGLRFSLAGKNETARPWGLKLDFLGAQAHAQPVGQARTPAKVSYFKGSREDWKTGLPTYSRVAYRDVWPGVDLIYSGSKGTLKYSFLVKPGADPSAIQLGWQGASGIHVNRQGQLEVATPVRTLRDDAPVSYQRRAGRRVPVATSYSLGANNSYGFQVGSYDRSQPLVIDPAVLVYSGYIGGTEDEQANNVALDEDENLYVVGATTSADFPASVGPSTDFSGGVDDAFIAKVDPAGSGLVYAGYIGGADRDTAINVAVTPSGTDKGAAYVVGSTSSSACPAGQTVDCFPATGGPDTTYNGGPQDAWLAKVNPSGTALDYAGYIGGSGTFSADPSNPNNEQANGVAVDASGDAYVSGFTASDAASFPDGDGFGAAMPGVDQTLGNGPPNDPPETLLDAFVVKINEAGTAFDYATYLGGGAVDAGTGVALEQPPQAGQEPAAFVNVYTGSNEADPGPVPPVVPGAPNFFGGFPVTAGAYDESFNGEGPFPDDAAEIKLSADGESVVYGTYIGGTGNEQPFGNAVHATTGDVYITGSTSSDETTFPDGDGFGGAKPVTTGFDRTFNGPTDPNPPANDPVSNDTFVVRLNSDGSVLDYATYLGGSSGGEQAIAIAVDGLGAAYVSGQTDSSDFPVTNGPDSTYNGGPADAFATKLAPNGDALEFSGFIGGALSDIGLGMAVDSAGNAYISGSTESHQCDDAFPVRGGPDLTKNGAFGITDAFVAKIDPTGTATPGAGPSCPPPPGPPGGGGGGGGPASPSLPGAPALPGDLTAPVISRLTASPRVFRVARTRRASSARTRARATTLRYRLSERATVRFRIQRKSIGRRVAGRCRRTTRLNRRRRACVRYVSVGRLSRSGVQGSNRLRFAGRLRGRALAPGRYRVLAVATDRAGNRSRTRRTSFRIVRR